MAKLMNGIVVAAMMQSACALSADPPTGYADHERPPDGPADRSPNVTEPKDDPYECQTEYKPAGAADAPAPTCTPTNQPYIYFTTWADQRLWVFDPAAARVDFVTRIACSRCRLTTGIGASAVDGSGRIWLYYAHDRIYIVDPKTMLCEPTPLTDHGGERMFRSMSYVPGPNGGAIFATTGRDGVDAADRFVRIDPTDYTVEDLGPIEEPSGFRALAGRADGRLFAILTFFADSGQDRRFDWRLIEMDPLSGSTMDSLLIPDESDLAAIPLSLTWWEEDLVRLGWSRGTPSIASAHLLDLATGELREILADFLAEAEVTSSSTFTGAGTSRCER